MSSLTSEAFARFDLATAAAGLAAGDFTAGDLLAASLERMKLFEPSINAMITLDPEGAGEAASKWKKGDAGPLAGMPVAVKDNIMTRGLRSTCGSKMLDNFVPPYDAAVVERLRAGGAVMTGKANMDEFAMGSTGETSAYGPSYNPWNNGLVTGGSSSGSAAVVAYGGVLASLASDTGGSIRQPANYCGLVGVKPTYGRVSRWGVGALASSLDQVGVLTRTVRGNVLMFDLIAGYDRRDSTSSPKKAEPCLASLDDGIAGLTIGFDPALFDKDGVHPSRIEALKKALDVCRAAGAKTVEKTLPLIDYTVAAYYIICCCEASTNLARFDGVRYGVRKQGDDLWDTFSETRGQGFGEEVKRRIIMGSYALSSGYYDAFYLKAAKVRRLLVDAYAKLMGEVDVFLLPVSPQPPRPIGTTATALENYLGDIFTLPANLAGIPALAFPTGTVGGLPAGVQGMAGWFREDVLYRVARVVEKESALDNAPWTRATPEGAK